MNESDYEEKNIDYYVLCADVCLHMKKKCEGVVDVREGGGWQFIQFIYRGL